MGYRKAAPLRKGKLAVKLDKRKISIDWGKAELNDKNESEKIGTAQVTGIEISRRTKEPEKKALKRDLDDEFINILTISLSKKIELADSFIVANKVKPVDADIPAITDD